MIPPKTPSIPFSSQIRDVLKKVDTLLKKGELDGAEAEIRLAKEAEPKNMYVHAYVERIQLLMEERKRNMEAEEVSRKAEEEAKTKFEAERKLRLAEEIKRKLEAEHARKTIPVSKRTAAQPSGTGSVQRGETRPHSEELADYCTAVSQAWQNGIPGREETAKLQKLAGILHVTPEEHAAFEKSARREAYIRAFKAVWSSREAAQGPSTITALHKKFGISSMESGDIDLELLSRARQPRTRPHLVVIDDDENLLAAMSDMLCDRGFDVKPFTTSDDAYRFLLHSTPDLILADINLETSTMGGFAFFEKLQQIPRLAVVPFIFVSGLTDEVVIRAGKELGADDYITKPFVGETLTSVIKGKLRRYSELASAQKN